MLDIYWAVRRAIQRHTRASHMFAHIPSPYPFEVCQAFVKFERQNRGHRKLLTYPELSVFAAESRLSLYNPLNIVTIRNRLGMTAYELFQSVINATTLPDTAEMQDVLGARDTRGYFAAFSQQDLREYIETVGFTARTSFDLEKLRLEHGVGSETPHTLHLLLDVDGVKVRRAVSLSAGSFHTLGGARLLLADARKRLDALLEDISDWPELAPPPEKASSDAVSVPAPSITQPVIITAELQAQLHAIANGPQPAPEESAQMLAETCIAAGLAPPPVAPAAPTVDTVIDEEAKAALLARLERDLSGFLSVYTAETRAFLAQHWAELRRVVPASVSTT